MTPNQLREAAVKIFGTRYRSSLPRAIGKSRYQTWRYLNGTTEIPKLVEIVVKSWLEHGISKDIAA